LLNVLLNTVFCSIKCWWNTGYNDAKWKLSSRRCTIYISIDLNVVSFVIQNVYSNELRKMYLNSKQYKSKQLYNNNNNNTSLIKKITLPFNYVAGTWRREYFQLRRSM